MKRVLAFLMCLVMLFSLVACGGKQGNGNTAQDSSNDTTTTPSQNGEEGSVPGVKKDLIIGTAQDINQLNLLLQSDTINNNCLKLTHQGLITRDNQTNAMIPLLAESWEWTDDTHMVFHLKKGVCFSTGEPLTAKDVVFTYERAMSTDPTISVHANTLAAVKAVKALDDYTIELTTTGYSNELIMMLEHPALGIQSKVAYEDPSIEEPWYIGSGQYQYVEWKEGQYVKFARNENYWGDDPGMADEIIFKPLLETSQRVIALQNGEIDVCVDPPSSELQFLEADDNIAISKKDGTRKFFLSFNCDKEPFNNETLRQAVSCAIDKEYIIDVVTDGLATTQTSVLQGHLQTALSDEEVGGYTYDVEKAKALLAEAGYKPGELTVDLYAATDDPYKTIAPIVQANLAVIGINVNIVSLDQTTLKSECAAGNQQMYLWRWNTGTRLDEVFRELYHSEFNTFTHLSDPYVDEMGEKVLTEKDATVREQHSHDLQKYLAESAVEVVLYIPEMIIAHHKNLEGTYFFGGGDHRWNWAYVALD